MSVKKEAKKVDLSNLGEKWPSATVVRSEVRTFSGGMVAPGTLANCDSRGVGPEGSFKFGNKRVYRVEDLIHWLEKRASTKSHPPVKRTS